MLGKEASFPLEDLVNRFSAGTSRKFEDNFDIFRWVHPSLYEGVSVRRSVGRMVGRSVCNLFFFRMPKMDNFLYKNHCGSPGPV